MLFTSLIKYLDEVYNFIDLPMHVLIYFPRRILPDLSLGVRALLAVGQDPHRAAVFGAARPAAGAHVCLVTHTLTHRGCSHRGGGAGQQ